MILWEDAGDTAATVSAATPLPVNIVAGSSAGTEYTEGATDASISGGAVLGEAPSDTLSPIQLDASGNLKVNVAAGGASGTQYTEADTDTSITGTAVMWEDTSDTLRAVSASKPLPVGDAGGSLTVDGTVTANAGSGPFPVSDNGGSLTVDGSVTATQGTAANLNATVVGTGTFAVQADTELTTADLDTGAGTDTRAVVGLVGSKSGGGALIPGDATAGLKVDLGADNDVVISDGGNVISVDDNGGSLTVDVGTALPAGTNAIGKLAANSGVDIGDVDVTSVTPGTGATSLGKAEDAGHTTGDTGVYALAVRDDDPAPHSGTDGDYESIHVSASGGVWASEVATAAGGTDVFFTLDADVTEEDVKTSAGSVYGWYIYNDGAAEAYVKLYNATAANVTVGTTTPKMVIPIPAGSAANVGFTPGIKFDTAICIAAVTGVANSDTTDVAANQVVANIFYK